MKLTDWPKVSIQNQDGISADAIAPLIISASRATDIPAFYPEWFIECLDRNWIEWINPFNGKAQIISFKNTRLIVFWTKNPHPLFPYLQKIRQKGIHILFQITINDYEHEGLEPGVPPLESRIESILELSDRIGRDGVFWRFDPLIISESVTPEILLGRIEKIGNRIAPAVSRCTVSFLSPYSSVLRRMKQFGMIPAELTDEVIKKIGEGLFQLSNKWNLDIVSCAEKKPLHKYGILPGSCIDPVHIVKVFGNDRHISRFISQAAQQYSLFMDTEYLQKKLKDPGQRPLCNCMRSKDIGRYGTCAHGCIYCYANRKTSTAPNQ